MVGQPRSTFTVRIVLQALAAADGPMYGRQIVEQTGLFSGTVHPILVRLERAGWVTSEWEDIDPKEVGRPARRFYTLTDEGRTYIPDDRRPTP